MPPTIDISRPSREQSRTRRTKGGPGAVSLSEIAEHLAVDRDTARKLIDADRTPDLKLRKQPTYAWSAIWRMCGETNVAQIPLERWGELMEPLLTISPVAVALGVVPATARRYATEGLLPVIRLNTHLNRVRPCVLRQYLEVGLVTKASRLAPVCAEGEDLKADQQTLCRPVK